MHWLFRQATSLIVLVCFCEYYHQHCHIWLSFHSIVLGEDDGIWRLKDSSGLWLRCTDYRTSATSVVGSSHWRCEKRKSSNAKRWFGYSSQRTHEFYQQQTDCDLYLKAGCFLSFGCGRVGSCRWRTLVFHLKLSDFVRPAFLSHQATFVDPGQRCENGSPHAAINSIVPALLDPIIVGLPTLARSWTRG